jgi:hypothetical protein
MLDSPGEDSSMVAGKVVVMDGRRSWEGGGYLALSIPARLSKPAIYIPLPQLLGGDSADGPIESRSLALSFSSPYPSPGAKCAKNSILPPIKYSPQFHLYGSSTSSLTHALRCW